MWSIILWAVGWGFFGLRRANLWEQLKHAVPFLNPLLRTPARYTDFYILASWALLAVITVLTRSEQRWFPFYRGLAVWWAIQIVQTSLYHNIWRKLIFKDRSHPMGETYNPVRNTIIAFFNFSALAWLFGLAYWWSGPHALKGVTEISQAIFFSFTTASTVGYGDFHPCSGRTDVHCLVIAQMLMSLVMLAVILTQVVSSIGYLKSRQDRD